MRPIDDQLLHAAERGETRHALDLLRHGAAINVQDEQGRTPVMRATYTHQSETVAALIRAGADIDVRDNTLDNPLNYASAAGLLDIVRLAIDAHADTRLTNRYGGVSLIPAAERGHVEIVRELLTRSDVEVNHVNNLGWTALLEAIILGTGGLAHQQIVQLLVNHGADVHLADKDGVTPLEHAQKRGFTAIASTLEKAGA
jgi:ankyrin repeat protein